MYAFRNSKRGDDLVIVLLERNFNESKVKDDDK